MSGVSVVGTPPFAPSARLAAVPGRGTSPHGGRAAMAFGGVLEAVGDAEGLDALLRPASRAACALVGADRCAIYLRDRDAGRLRGRLGHPGALERAVRRRSVDVADTPSARTALRDGRAVAVGTDGDALSWAHRGSVVVVSIAANGRTFGIAVVEDEDRRRTFTEEDLADLRAFFVHVARWMGHDLGATELRAARRSLARERVAVDRAARLERALATPAAESAEGTLRVLAEVSGLAAELRAVTGVLVAVAGPPAVPDVPALDRGAAEEVVGALTAADAGTGRVVSIPGPHPEGRASVAAARAGVGGGGCFVLLRAVDVDRPVVAGDAALAARAAVACAASRSAPGQDDPTRRLLLAALLGGRPGEDELGALADGSGASTARWVVAVAESAPGAPVAAGRHVAGDPWRLTALRLGGTEVVVAEVGERDAPRDLARRLRDRLAGPLGEGAGPAPRVAVSSLGTGVPGLRRAYREARALLELGADDGPGSSTVDELGARRLLLLTPGDVASFATDLLGPLLGDDPAGRRLRESLAAFVAHDGSVGDAAGALGVHVNTLRARFVRIEEATGLNPSRSLDDLVLVRAALSALPAR